MKRRHRKLRRIRVTGKHLGKYKGHEISKREENTECAGNVHFAGKRN